MVTTTWMSLKDNSLIKEAKPNIKDYILYNSIYIKFIRAKLIKSPPDYLFLGV